MGVNISCSLFSPKIFSEQRMKISVGCHYHKEYHTVSIIRSFIFQHKHKYYLKCCVLLDNKTDSDQ